ncbi:MAG: GNAT family N-acetyltransferase [Flavobacteriaceae bacterium]
MDNIRIREAVLSDLETLLTFEKELIKAERPFDECIRQDPVHYYDLKSLIEDKEVVVVVAEYKGRILSSGYAYSKKARSYLDHENYAYLGFMYTIPEFRGKGVNLMIIDSLSDWASKKGLSELRLTVYDENQPAIRAYEKAGFKKHIIEMRLRKT